VGTPGCSLTSREDFELAGLPVVSWGVECAASPPCATSTSGSVNAGLDLQGARVTVSDPTPPAPAAGGPLLAGGWRRSGEPVVLGASDTSGVRSLALVMDGATRGALTERCDPRRRAPCPVNAATTFSPGALADGAHTATLLATDTADNVARDDQPVLVDGSPPQAGLPAVDGRRLKVAVSDAVSGVTGGELFVRHSRVAVPYGHSVALSGRLTTTDGVPLAHQPISVTAVVHRIGARRAPPTATSTDARGRSVVRVPAGPSREVTLTYPGRAGLLRRVRDVATRVADWSSMHASPRRLFGPGRVRFSGRLGLRGARVPPGGKLVDLQAHDAGRRRTFATARARGRLARGERLLGPPGPLPDPDPHPPREHVPLRARLLARGDGRGPPTPTTSPSPRGGTSERACREADPPGAAKRSSARRGVRHVTIGCDKKSKPPPGGGVQT
jgi:hypothetical protein